MFKKILTVASLVLTSLIPTFSSNSNLNALESDGSFPIDDYTEIRKDFEYMGLNYIDYYNESHEQYTYDRNVTVAAFESYEQGSTLTGLYVYCYNPFKIFKDLETQIIVNGSPLMAKLVKIDSSAKISKYEIEGKMFDTATDNFRTYNINKFNEDKQVLTAEFSNFEDSVKFNFDSILPISSSKFFTVEYSNLKSWSDLKTIFQGGVTSSSANYSQHWYLFDTPTLINEIKEITIDYSYKIATASGKAYSSWTDNMTYTFKEPITTLSEKTYTETVTVKNDEFFKVNFKGYGGTLPCINNTYDLIDDYKDSLNELGYSNEFFKKNANEYYNWAICYELTPNTFASSNGSDGFLASEWQNEEFYGSKTVIENATMFSCIYEENGIVHNALAIQREKSEDGGTITIGPSTSEESKIKKIIKTVIAIIASFIIIKILILIFNFIGSFRNAFGRRK